MRRTERDRRNWSLLIFIIPLGIFLMFIVGQIALRMVPRWDLNTGMGSNLDYETESGDHAILSPLFNFQILTPSSWLGTYLTPNPASGWFFPPFIVIQPIATTTPISTSMPATTGTPKLLTATPPAPHTATKNIPPPPPVTSTKRPTNQPGATSSAPASKIPTATNTPTNTATNTATNTPTNTPTNTATTVPTGYPSTPDPSWTGPVSSDIVIGNPDGIISSIPNGSYTVLDINASPIIIVGSSENTYDLVYNEAEYNSSGKILLDDVILGISMFSDGQIYYEIFNWGNGIVDFNTNVSGVIEIDNQSIFLADLWNYPGTGILIDADNAPSQPPPQTYGYLVIICPISSADPIQVDSILIFP